MADTECKNHGLPSENDIQETACGKIERNHRVYLIALLKKLKDWYIIVACWWLGYTLLDMASMHWGIPGWHAVAYLFCNGMFGLILCIPGGWLVSVLEKVKCPSVIIKSITIVFGIVAIAVFLAGSGMDLYNDALTGKLDAATIIHGSKYITKGL